MAINTYLSTIEFEKQDKEAEQKQTHIYREYFNGCQIGGGGGWLKKFKGLRSTNWLLQNSLGDVKYGIGNIVNSILISMRGVRWV